MIRLTQEELNEVIRKHGLWLKNVNDPKGERADLSYKDLHELDFQSVNLTGANLACSNMMKTKLKSANFISSNLQNVNLKRSILTLANFYEANLCEANLIKANLTYINLFGANLKAANLNYANLRHANFWRANLEGASLLGADLRYARLYKTNLHGANIDYSAFPLWCGSFDVDIDKRIAVQMIYHLCRLKCDDEEFIALRNSMINFANKFHHIKTGDCNKLIEIPLPSSE
jgi:hypothetical protein